MSALSFEKNAFENDIFVSSSMLQDIFLQEVLTRMAMAVKLMMIVP